MPIPEPLRKGDWIRAENKFGAVLEGQVEHDISYGGSALLNLIFEDVPPLVSPRDPCEFTINVNFWKITLLRKNLIASQK